MKLQHLLVLLCAWPMLAQAEIYKSVDKDGHVTYSSSPIRGGKRIILEPNLSVPSERSRSTAAAENFPRVDGRTQRGRDDTRRQILDEELATEEKLLAEANQALKEGEAAPEVYRGKDGKTYRNVAKYDEKVKALKEQVDLHQRNVEALKTELSRLR
ncbi:MAG TPA: DUF4124 domain-containing protein [Gallionella sp.]|nr:DUF4124 domain-containing protein [Gallionella sp.]